MGSIGGISGNAAGGISLSLGPGSSVGLETGVIGVRSSLVILLGPRSIVIDRACVLCGGGCCVVGEDTTRFVEPVGLLSSTAWVTPSLGGLGGGTMDKFNVRAGSTVLSGRAGSVGRWCIYIGSGGRAGLQAWAPCLDIKNMIRKYHDGIHYLSFHGFGDIDLRRSRNN